MIRRCALLLLIALALTGCGGEKDEPAAQTPAARDGVVDVNNVLDLRAAFEADRGKTRLLMLLSPT